MALYMHKAFQAGTGPEPSISSQRILMPKSSISRVTHSRDNCVESHQKAVYLWYEAHHNDDEVVDIYSPEWQERITIWHTMLVAQYGSKHVHLKSLGVYDNPEELEFRVFFFAHSIATFSLWHVFKVFYALDKVICGTSSEADQRFAAWQQMKPFHYLSSDEVKRLWKQELKMLDHQIGCGDLTGGRLKSRLYDILRAVERLESSLESLEGDVQSENGQIEHREWILDTATKAFNERCFIIAETLKTGVNGYLGGEVLREVDETSCDVDIGSST
jgi:hypothetical protein